MEYIMGKVHTLNQPRNALGQYATKKVSLFKDDGFHLEFFGEYTLLEARQVQKSEGGSFVIENKKIKK